VTKANALPEWLAFVPCITGGDDDPVTPNPPVATEQNFGSEALGELLSRLDAKDDATKKLADDLKAAQDLLREQENAQLTAAQQAERDRKTALKTAEKRAEDAEKLAAAGEKAVAYAKSLGIKYGIEHYADDEGNIKYTWADVDTVVELLKLESIEIDFDKGTTKGLYEQLDTLAEKKPFLLKTGAPQAPPPNLGGPIGTPPAGGNTGNQPVTPQDANDLAALYPSMAKLLGGPTRPGYVVTSTSKAGV